MQSQPPVFSALLISGLAVPMARRSEHQMKLRRAIIQWERPLIVTHPRQLVTIWKTRLGFGGRDPSNSAGRRPHSPRLRKLVSLMGLPDNPEGQPIV